MNAHNAAFFPALTSRAKTAIIKDRMERRNKSIAQLLSGFFAWFIPGLGVKRWILMVLAGTTLLGVGLAVFVLDVYRTAPETWWLPLLSAASLRFLERPLRVIIFGGLGFILFAVGIWGMNRSIITPFIRPGHNVTDTLRSHRQRERGPRIVTIGGGHGLSALLRGLKAYSFNITAIVTVADDGGSSGRLRREMGVLPPGDIRNCLAALSNDEAFLSQLFQYRFPSGTSGLEGHSFGNLFITALAEITGSFEQAVAESGHVLAVKGRVLPSTLHNVSLQADVVTSPSAQEVRVAGESQITKTNGRVKHVWLEPHNPPAFPLAIQAILAADLIVIGPGSLYTSILPNFLVPDISKAVQASRALKLFVCNVATESGETDGFTCGDHLRAFEEHAGIGLFGVAVVNDQQVGKLPEGIEWVRIDPKLDQDYPIYPAELSSDTQPWQHDSIKLAEAVMDLYQERTGPLVE